MKRRSKNVPTRLFLCGIEQITPSTTDDIILRHKNGTIIIDGGRRLRLALTSISATNIEDPDNRFQWIPFTFEGSTSEHLILAAGSDLNPWRPTEETPDIYPNNKLQLIYEEEASNLKHAHFLEFASDNDSGTEELRMGERNNKVLKQQKELDKEETSDAPVIPTPAPTTTTQAQHRKSDTASSALPANTLTIDTNQSDSTKANNLYGARSGRGHGRRNHNRDRRNTHDDGSDATNNLDDISNSSSTRAGGSAAMRGRRSRRQNPRNYNNHRSYTPERYEQRHRYQESDRNSRDRSPYYQRSERSRYDYSPRRPNSSREYYREKSFSDRTYRNHHDDSRNTRENRENRERSPIGSRTQQSFNAAVAGDSSHSIAPISTAPTAPVAATGHSSGPMHNIIPNGTGIAPLAYTTNTPFHNNWSIMQPFQQSLLQQQPFQPAFGQWPISLPPNTSQSSAATNAWNGGFPPTVPPPAWNNTATPYNMQPPNFNQSSQPGGNGFNMHQPLQLPQNNTSNLRYHGSALGDDTDIQIVPNTGNNKMIKYSLFRYDKKGESF